MTVNPYVRPALAITRQGRADPAAVIQGWLDRLGGVLASASDESLARVAHDLLALWAALQRVRPELIEDKESRKILEEAHAVVPQDGPDMAPQARAGVDLESWRARARAFAERDDDDPDTDATRAVALLATLDEADLLAWALRRLGMADEALEAELRALGDWLEDNAAHFVPAAAYVQSVGLALRPDLPAWDLDLAWTADKYVILLDELERVEVELSLATAPPLPQGMLAALRKREATAPLPAVAWLPPLRPAVVAAAAGAESMAPRPRMRRWRSPDGLFEAILVLPEFSDPEREQEPVRINFFASGQPARALTGQVVRLAGVAAVIDAEANAAFLLCDLRAAASGPVLQVGSRGTEWIDTGPE
jgi:hypothetical protein